MNKIILYITLAVFSVFLGVNQIKASETVITDTSLDGTIFKARVVEIIEETEKINEKGQTYTQQNLKLIGLEKEFKDQEVKYQGISEIELIDNKVYKTGDRVFVLASYENIDNTFKYYVLDYSRGNYLLYIFLVFFLSLILVSRWKGVRALISLIITFLIIIFFIVPMILNGANPVLVTLIGSIVILFFVIYLTEGFTARSHISAISAFISLLLVIFTSWFFIVIGKLSGVFSDDVFIILNIGHDEVNFKGLLLAGIIIGALGVVDDLIVSQVASVEQITESNPEQDWKTVFKRAYDIGISHVSSMTNTLFLAYAGASLPLLMLFSSPDNPFTSFEQIISNEAVSTEIIRALSGSVAIILSVPLSTFLAAWWFVYKKRKER